MKGIQCKNGHVFAMIIDSESNTAEWKLEEHYYKSQGCEIVKEEYLSFSKHDAICGFCNSLEHEFENLIEEIKNNN